jgi:hypothetical protein
MAIVLALVLIYWYLGRKGRVCATCGRRIPVDEDGETCEKCGRIHHRVCFESNGGRLSGTLVAGLCPDMKDEILGSARLEKIGELEESDEDFSESVETEVSRIPEEVLAKGYKVPLCGKCLKDILFSDAFQYLKRLESEGKSEEAAAAREELGRYDKVTRFPNMTVATHSRLKPESYIGIVLILLGVVVIAAMFVWFTPDPGTGDSGRLLIIGVILIILGVIGFAFPLVSGQ